MKDKSSNQFNPLEELTPELMEGYVNGTLTPEVMQQVEKFLSENPFEAEAIEGLKLQNINLSEDLAELDDRLSRSLPSERQHKAWRWQLAAAIALLAISGLVFYLVAPLEQKNAPVAVNQQGEDESPHEYSEIPEEDIIIQGGSDTEETVIAEDEIATARDEIKGVPNSEALARTPDKPASDPASTTPDNHESELAIEPATPIDTDVESRQNHAPQQSIKFELDNSTPSADDQTAGLQASPADAESSLEERAQEFLTSELSPPKAQTKSTTTRKKNATPISQLPEADSPPGWGNYISKELKVPDSALTNGISGKVALTFQVGADGIPFDFRVSKSLGFGCDEEAIRLVLNGPKWKPAIIGGNPVISIGKVEIKFP